MGTLQTRLASLELTHRTANPALVVVLREAEPTAAQREQIAQAERQGRKVRIIRFTRAEDAFPNFTGLPRTLRIEAASETNH